MNCRSLSAVERNNARYVANIPPHDFNADNEKIDADLRQEEAEAAADRARERAERDAEQGTGA